MEKYLEILKELKSKINNEHWEEKYIIAIDNLTWEYEHQKEVIERYKYENKCLEKGIEHEGRIVQETKNTVAHIDLFHDLFSRR